MTYASPTISRQGEGRHIVRAPRATDAIGYALRGAFDGTTRMPDDMEQMLRRLDAVT